MMMSMSGAHRLALGVNGGDIESERIDGCWFGDSEGRRSRVESVFRWLGGDDWWKLMMLV
jgi:hypothetical protein